MNRACSALVHAFVVTACLLGLTTGVYAADGKHYFKPSAGDRGVTAFIINGEPPVIAMDEEGQRYVEVSPSIRYGFKDAKGKVILEPNFLPPSRKEWESVPRSYTFIKGHAAVRTQGGWGLIDLKGNPVGPQKLAMLRPWVAEQTGRTRWDAMEASTSWFGLREDWRHLTVNAEDPSQFRYTGRDHTMYAWGWMNQLAYSDAASRFSREWGRASTGQRLVLVAMPIGLVLAILLVYWLCYYIAGRWASFWMWRHITATLILLVGPIAITLYFLAHMLPVMGTFGSIVRSGVNRSYR